MVFYGLYDVTEDAYLGMDAEGFLEADHYYVIEDENGIKNFKHIDVNMLMFPNKEIANYFKKKCEWKEDLVLEQIIVPETCRNFEKAKNTSATAIFNELCKGVIF